MSPTEPLPSWGEEHACGLGQARPLVRDIHYDLADRFTGLDRKVGLKCGLKGEMTWVEKGRQFACVGKPCPLAQNIAMMGSSPSGQHWQQCKDA
jgi:hypothetical protein